MWNLKYYSDWIDDKGNNNRVEILTEQLATSQEVRLTGFSIQYPEFDLFSDKAVYGAGANLTIVSEGALDYMDELYTIDPKGLQLRHYVNSSLNFIGYIDTEQYYDDFFSSVNYDFSISANNGIAVLDRIKISDDSGTELSGIYNALDMIKYALNKLEISYDNLYTGISTAIDSLALNETILHKINVKAGNYVDEKGNWMSCREVINTILLPLTLKMFIVGNDIYIVDINKLARADNLILKQYSFSNLTYVQDITNSNVFDIDKVVNGNVLTKQSGVSKVDVKFNKYVYETPSELTNDNLSGYTSEQIRIKDDGETQEEYIEKYYNNGWCNIMDTNNVVFVNRRKTQEADNGETFVRITGNETVTPSIEINTNQNFTSAKQYLRLNGQIMVEDVNNFLIEEEIEPFSALSEARYRFHVQITTSTGEYIDVYKGHTGAWGSMDDDYNYDFLESSYTTFVMQAGAANNNRENFPVNRWIDINKVIGEDADRYSFIIPLNSDNTTFTGYEDYSLRGGKLKFKLWIEKYPFPDVRPNKVYTLAIKDLSFTLVTEDEYGNFIDVDNNDEEYKGKINSDYVNDLQVETKHGTDVDGNSRGMFVVKLDGSYTDSNYATNERLVNLNNLTREGFTGTSEELLLRTYLSNLQLSRYKYNTTLLSYHSILDRFKYKLYRDGIQCRLIPVGMTCDYLRGESTVNLLEIVKDE